MRVMSTINLVSSFWHVARKENYRDYTTFTYKDKVYQFEVTQFGLSSNLSNLARGLDCALSAEVKGNMIIYIDDCLLFKWHQNAPTSLSPTIIKFEKEKHYSEFRKIGFLQWNKIFKLTSEFIQPTSEKVAAIKNFPRPRNQKWLQVFPGFTNCIIGLQRNTQKLCNHCYLYYKRDILFGSKILKMLSKMLRNYWECFKVSAS